MKGVTGAGRGPRRRGQSVVTVPRLWLWRASGMRFVAVAGSTREDDDQQCSRWPLRDAGEDPSIAVRCSDSLSWARVPTWAAEMFSLPGR